MDNETHDTKALEELLGLREQTLLQQQQQLDEQQRRLEQTFHDLVEVTRQLRITKQSQEEMALGLQEKTQALRDAEVRIGTLVAQIEERQRMQHGLEEVVKRQSKDLGRLVSVMEKRNPAAEPEGELLSPLKRSPLRSVTDVAKPPFSKQAEQFQQSKAKQKMAGWLQAGRMSAPRCPDWLDLRQPYKKVVSVFKRGSRQALIEQDVALIERSPWFDANWYLSNYPDVAADEAACQSPARHYLLVGGFAGLNPGPGFDSAAYIACYDDVRESAINPLLHFIKFGEKEQRHPKAMA